MTPNSLGVMPGGVGRQYTYGVDAKGLAYVYDKTAGKMVYYGNQGGASQLVSSLSLNGARVVNEGTATQPTASVANVAGGGGGGQTPLNVDLGNGNGNVSGATAPKVLDQAQLDSLDSLINSLGTIRDQSKQKAALKRDASLNEKKQERTQEESKYNGKKLSTLQDFAGAKTETDLNTRDTLENLVSSLSTLGLGGGRALTRQILDAANRSNRKANATQATNNQQLDTAFNEYTAGNENDIKKIQDQYGYDTGEADRTYLQGKQSALYKKADVYNAADHAAERGQVMKEASDLNGLIAGSAFMNPSYTGETRQMATPDLASYTQDIAKYDTTPIGAGAPGGVMPVAAEGAGAPGNVGIRAIAVNNKDLGVKKKQAGDLGYGV